MSFLALVNVTYRHLVLTEIQQLQICAAWNCSGLMQMKGEPTDIWAAMALPC